VTERKKRVRVLTVKIAPSTEQWQRLRELAWQAMQYKNAFIRARWAESVGLRVDPAKGDSHDVSKHIRRMEKGELSAAVYASLEREVQALVTRDWKKILAGAPLPQWRQADSLSVRGPGTASLAEPAGFARIVEKDGKFFADLPLNSKDSGHAVHMEIPLAGGTEIDDFQAPLLKSMAACKTVVGKMIVCFNVKRGRTLLRISYEQQYDLPPVGKRVATLGPLDKTGRLLLRNETQTVDFTAKLAHIRKMADDWDLIRRRVACQIGRRRGHARAKRRKFAELSPDGWFHDQLHQWSRQVVTWCAGQGVGRLVVLDLGSGLWAAHKFVEQLKYKGEDAGVAVEAVASLEDASTDRAAKNIAKKEQAKARRLQKAVRTVTEAVVA